MNLFRMALPVVALAALTACEDGGSSTGVVSGNRASVRFVNAVSDGGSITLVGNGRVLGSALARGAVSSSCALLDAGIATLALGTGSNTPVVRPVLATGSVYTVVATGTTADPDILVLNNTTTTTPSIDNVSVRFVNATSAPTVDVFATRLDAVQFGAPATSSLALNRASSFVVLPTTNRVTVTTAGTATQLFTSDFNLTSGNNLTVVLLPNVTNTGLETVVANGSCN